MFQFIIEKHPQGGKKYDKNIVLNYFLNRCMESFAIDKHIQQQLHLTLADFQFDAQNSYLFTYNTFITILYMFRALLCPSSGGLRLNCIHAASRIVTL